MGGKWKKHKAAATATAPESAVAAVALPLADAAVTHQASQAQQLAVTQAQAMAPAAAAKQQRPQPKKQQHQHQKQQGAAAAATPSGGAPATLSIAVPGSAIAHAPSAEVAAAIAAQIARTAAIFGADEVVVYDDSGQGSNGSVSAAAATLARLLQYMETPGHLRPVLFPASVAYPELRAAEAVCPSLHTQHHQRQQEQWQPYREGVVMRSEPGMGSFVDMGYDRNAHVDVDLPACRRVTLSLGAAPHVEFVPAFSETMIKAQVVPPSEPRQRTGRGWGFSVRLCSSLSRAVKECPWTSKGYDLLVGASPSEGVVRDVAELVLPHYRHAMVVVAGDKSLEETVEEDEAFAQAGKSASDLFGMYLNPCPRAGVPPELLRSEDALTVTLAYMHASLLKFGNR